MVSRALRNGSKGADVKTLQRQINLRFRYRKVDDRLVVDGECGPATIDAAQRIGYLLGCLPSTVSGNEISKGLQRVIRDPASRTPEQLARAKRRKAEDAHASAATKAVRYAQSKIGVKEQPAGSNSGPQISDWIKRGGGVPGWAWCQYFVNACLVAAGGPQLQTGWTVAVLQWGRNHTARFRSVTKSEAKPGDWVYFRFPGSNALCDHVGILVEIAANGDVICVEGNTSSGNSGSQSNGGGVYLRRRSGSLVAGIVRPPYPTK